MAQKFNLVKSLSGDTLHENLGISHERSYELTEFILQTLKGRTEGGKTTSNAQLIQDTLNEFEIEKIEEIILIAFIVGVTINPSMKLGGKE